MNRQTPTIETNERTNLRSGIVLVAITMTLFVGALLARITFLPVSTHNPLADETLIVMSIAPNAIMAIVLFTYEAREIRNYAEQLLVLHVLYINAIAVISVLAENYIRYQFLTGYLQLEVLLLLIILYYFVTVEALTIPETNP